MDSRRKKMEEGKESNAKRHLPLPRTVKISIACFFHVDDGNVLLFCFFFLVCFFVLFFSRGGEIPRALPAAMVLYVREKMSSHWRTWQASCWTTMWTVVAIQSCPSTQLPGAGIRDVLWGWPSACSTHRAAGTMGHGPFHCIAPSLTSLAAVFMVIDTLAAPPVARSITWPQHTSDRIYWITLPVLSYGCVCVCVYACICIGMCCQ